MSTNYLVMHARKIDFYSIGSGAVMVGVSRFGDGHGSQGALRGATQRPGAS